MNRLSAKHSATSIAAGVAPDPVASQRPEAFDDLISFALPDESQTVPRRYAWAISINLLFLAIGMAGAPERALARRELTAIDDPALENIVIEPTPTTPQTTPDEPEPESEPDNSEAPAVVAVTLDSPAVSFSVPTVGNLIVPASAAQAPPARPMQVAKKETGPAIINIRATDSTGDRPAPTYPPQMQNRGIQGTVVLLISVDAEGRKQDVTIKESSGNRDLDDHTHLWVLKHWIRFPKADGPRQYLCPIKFQIAAKK